MSKDEALKLAYISFMGDYLRLGHMREVTPEELADKKLVAHYLPHHGVWQRYDEGRKLRVVYNASRPTTTGNSLNDIVYSGPKRQSDLPTVINRWRRHKYVFCTDIKMMFRQININTADIHLQRVLWSPRPEEHEKHYVLLTVTYGEACAPFLALRTLQQLASDEGGQYPEAVKAIRCNLYVDDFLCGADDVSTAIQLRNQLRSLLAAGGFDLKKWVSNNPDILEGLPECDCLRSNWLQFSTEGPVSELGIVWDPVTDCFSFTSPRQGNCQDPTKRRILAVIAGIFDPAGWLSPIIVVAKFLLQDLWRAKLEWDDPLPVSMTKEWRTLRINLQNINTIKLPRWLQHSPSSQAQLHVFSDASRRAMAAVVYYRTQNQDGTARVVLVSAKTKLTPIRSLKSSSQTPNRMTIPRLELRAALLAARLLRTVVESLDSPWSDCFAWSDSQVALHWIKSTEPVGNELIDNYVCHIQEVMPKTLWRHVRSHDNPADITSRGATVEELRQHPLWWNGPTWLRKPPSSWPTSSAISRAYDSKCEALEVQTTQCLCNRLEEKDYFTNFSSLIKLLRAITICRRCLQRCAKQISSLPTAPIGAQDLQLSFIACVRLCQARDFPQELARLRRKEPVSTSSSLKRLDPFIDGQGTIRVGGRLHNSLLSYDERHPVVLDGRSNLAELVIDWAHERTLRGGFGLTYAQTVRRAWVIGGRRRVKARLRRCVVCVKLSSRTVRQVMAPLPAARVTPSRPFSRVGVDYAGPFTLLRNKGRGVATTKGYVALFVCLSTKAVHLELVGDLSTKSFLGALSRLVGRRGKPSEIWSDNATNFRGTDLELRRLLHAAKLDWRLVEGSLATDGIKWNFIPASAPHFGGLWEAGVKSCKRHLRRVAGPRKIIYEEFYTLLVEVEMMLNCRPLLPICGDFLTPAHFLIGGPLTSIPQPNVNEPQPARLAHWELVKGLKDAFWIKWSREYLNTLQQRHKWTRPRANVSVGDVVVLVDSSLLKPQGRWPLGRIVKVHPGQDGLVRVATVKTADGTYTRPIVKLVPLPVTDAAPESQDAPPHGGRHDLI